MCNNVTQKCKKEKKELKIDYKAQKLQLKDCMNKLDANATMVLMEYCFTSSSNKHYFYIGGGIFVFVIVLIGGIIFMIINNNKNENMQWNIKLNESREQMKKLRNDNSNLKNNNDTLKGERKDIFDKYTQIQTQNLKWIQEMEKLKLLN